MKKTNPYSHFYLYAKNWYRKSDDVIFDLKNILSNYTGVDFKYLSERDVRVILLEISKKEIIEYKTFPFEHFIYNCETDGLISACLSVIACAPSGNLDRLPLDKPNSNILPLA
jgi:hypothetical protein